MNTVTAPRLLAASNDPLVLGSAPQELTLRFLPLPRLPPPGRLPRISLVGAEPDMARTPYRGVFLNFENMVGQGRPPVVEIYLDTPSGADPADDRNAGALPFYGLAASSTPSAEHDGSGQRVALDITELFNRLRTQPEWDGTQLRVLLVPRKPMPEGAAVRIGRVSLYLEAD
jgi:hypothetical protein